MVHYLLAITGLVVVVRLMLACWMAFERYLLHKQGLPATLLELNRWTTPSHEIVKRTTSLRRVLGEIEKQFENPSDEHTDQIYRLAAQLTIESDGNLLEVMQPLAELIARETNTPLRRVFEVLDVKIPLNQMPLAENAAAPIRDCAAACATQIEQLHAILRDGPCQFTLDFTPWPDVNLSDHISKLRKAAQLFQQIAIIESDAGRSDEAIKALEVCFLLTSVLRDEPTTISQIGRSGRLIISIEGVEQVLSRCTLSASQLEAIRSGAAVCDRPDAFIRAAAGENCLVTSGGGMYNHRRQWKIARLWKRKPKWWSWQLVYELPLTGLGFVEFRKLVYIVLSRFYISALSRKDEDISGALDKYYKLVARIPKILSPSTPGTIMSTPNNDPVKMKTRLNALQTVLGVEAFRLDFGRLPNDDSELVAHYLDRMPLALVNGKTFRFIRKSRGYEVRSASAEKAAVSDDEQSLVREDGIRVLR